MAEGDYTISLFSFLQIYISSEPKALFNIYTHWLPKGESTEYGEKQEQERSYENALSGPVLEGQAKYKYGQKYGYALDIIITISETKQKRERHDEEPCG